MTSGQVGSGTTRGRRNSIRPRGSGVAPAIWPRANSPRSRTSSSTGGRALALWCSSSAASISYIGGSPVGVDPLRQPPPPRGGGGFAAEPASMEPAPAESEGESGAGRVAGSPGGGGGAVEVDGRAADEGGALGEEVGDQVAGLLGLADAAQRN